MKTVWIVMFCLLAGSAWAEPPQFRCETMLYVYNTPNIHEMIKNRIVLEVAKTWRSVTGRDIERLDDMFIYLNCLSTPDATVTEAVHKALQTQRVELVTER